MLIAQKWLKLGNFKFGKHAPDMTPEITDTRLQNLHVFVREVLSSGF